MSNNPPAPQSNATLTMPTNIVNTVAPEAANMLSNFWEKSIGYFFFLLLFMYFTLKTLWDILKWKRILKKGIEKLTSKDLKLMEKYINWDT